MKNKTKTQLDLFHMDYIPAPRRTYFSLGINEKINVKANSQGFAMNYLRGGCVCWRDSIGTIQRSDHPEKLTATWELFYLHNHHKSMDTLRWTDSVNPSQPTKQRKLQLL